MTKPEAQQLIDKCSELWPDWEPSETVLRVWLDHFSRLPDPRIVGRAIEEYYAGTGGRYRKPHIKPIVDIVHQFQAGREALREDESRGFCGVFVYCKVARADRPGQLGRFIPLLFARNANIPDNPDVILRIAEEMRQRYENMWGGEWAVMRDADYDRMFMLREELRSRAGYYRPKATKKATGKMVAGDDDWP